MLVNGTEGKAAYSGSGGYASRSLETSKICPRCCLIAEKDLEDRAHN